MGGANANQGAALSAALLDASDATVNHVHRLLTKIAAHPDETLC